MCGICWPAKQLSALQDDLSNAAVTYVYTLATA
jgi:hypothetical protein